MKQISRLRFNALAGYIRSPQTLILSEELDWYSEANERVLGVLIKDGTDEDYSCIVLARDRVGRYRAVYNLPFSDSIDEVRQAIAPAMQKWAAKDATEYEQGDERGKPVDFFTPVVPPERLHPTFMQLINNEAFSPARDLIAAMMYYYQDPDGNFVEQFQTTGFDARFWELYLFAVLAELRYSIDRAQPAPDFLCSGLLGEFFVEAVTVNPTIINGRNVETGPPDNPAERERYMEEYVPIKYGSPLYSKLNRCYWELPHINGKPIVLAIQDFHYRASMTWSESALIRYLYGREFAATHNDTGELVITSQTITQHCWGQKIIPSGFFYLPGAEHISAVISNPQGTISKFNRMGLKAGFDSPRVRMTRVGSHYDHDRNIAVPKSFVVNVSDPNYKEDWIEGLSVYHNPNTLISLPVEMFPGAAQHFLENDRLRSIIPDFHPYGSYTVIGLDGGQETTTSEG